MNKEKKQNLEEMSAMMGGAVEVGTGPAINREDEEKSNESNDYYISRAKFIEELKLREVIKEMILSIKNEKLLQEQKQRSDTLELRTILKKLIKEAKKDIEDTPHSSTAINLLEDLLKALLPNLETDYKTLTTKKEQRDSFRAHVVNAVSTLFETEDVNKEGGAAAIESGLLNLDEQEDEIEEEIEIKVSDVDASAEDKFIDIEDTVEEPQQEEDTFGIEGQDETGRALAQKAFDNMEKNITETYSILTDEEDEKLFKDYLITNIKLYFDKWEKELGAVTEPTTDEYEAEKEEGGAGGDAGEEFGGELGGEAPAAGAGEELIQ